MASLSDWPENFPLPPWRQEKNNSENNSSSGGASLRPPLLPLSPRLLSPNLYQTGCCNLKIKQFGAIAEKVSQASFFT